MIFAVQLLPKKELAITRIFNFWNRNQKKSQPKSLITSTIAYSMILVVGTTAVVTYGIVRNLILDNLKENALLKIQKSASEIDEWLASLQSQVATIANNSAVRSMQWSVAEPVLQIELDRSPDYHMFLIHPPDGSIYTTKTGLAKGKNAKDRPHFLHAMAGEDYISDLIISRSTGVRQINVSTPIWSIPIVNRNQIPANPPELRAKSLAALGLPSDPFLKPKPIGVLSGAVPVDRITKIVGKISNGEGSYAFALDSQGVPIAYPDRDILQKAKTILNEPQKSLAAVYQAMVNGEKDTTKVEINRKWYYIAYTPIKRASWSIAIVIPQANLESKLAPLNILASGIAALLILATIIAIRQLQLLEQTKIKAAEEEMLNGITKRIRESLDIQTILQTTVDEVASLLKLDRVNFSWYRQEERRLEIICENSSPRGSGKVGFPAIGDLKNLSDRFHRLETICINDVNEIIGSEAIHQDPLPALIQSFLALPVQVQNHSCGYLCAIHSKPWIWSDREKELLSNVTDQLAIAIEQSYLLDRTSQQVKIVSEQAEQLAQTLTELKRTQGQLIQSEKMSSLGQIVAGMAHEINNPVSFIYGNLIHANQYTRELIEVLHLYQTHYPQVAPEITEKIEELDLDFAIEDLPKLLNSMKSGAERIQQIIVSLRNFARFEEAELKLVNIHEGISSALMILQHRLHLQNKSSQEEIQIVKEYGQLPLVECYAGQLNQVFMNILNNAIDSLESRGVQDSLEELSHQHPTIWIRTEIIEEGRIAIRIKDNGKGMTEEVKQRLFDPFFTTKTVGKGTGLGLSIAYQIVVEKHGGSLQCISEPDRGAEFLMEIPITQTYPEEMTVKINKKRPSQERKR